MIAHGLKTSSASASASALLSSSPSPTSHAQMHMTSYQAWAYEVWDYCLHFTDAQTELQRLWVVKDHPERTYDPLLTVTLAPLA